MNIQVVKVKEGNKTRMKKLIRAENGKGVSSSVGEENGIKGDNNKEKRMCGKRAK